MQSITVPTKWFLRAASLAKITTLPKAQDNSILDHALVTVYHDRIQVTSTNEITASNTVVPLVEVIPDLEESPLVFLVGAERLADLLSEIDTENFIFHVDSKKHSLVARVQSSDLILSTRAPKDWCDIEDRFTPLESEDEDLGLIPRNTIKAMLAYNRFFLSNGQDHTMHLIEIRGGQAISSDRVKFGYYASPDFGEVELRIPGDLISSLEKALDQLPDEPLQVGESNAYNLISTITPKLSVTLGFVKCSATLPEAFDKVPLTEEPDQAHVDRVYLSKALSRMSIVAPKSDPRVKFTLSGSGSKAKITLSSLNELGQESRDVIPTNRTQGDDSKSVSVILPLGVIQKALKLSGSATCVFKFFDNNYLKICETSETTATFSIFKSLPRMQS